ncbi:NAD(+) diphosphatase [Williamsia sp. CHRR-6]|uniref:NAD(+) diphosphatase n=1 Tax=Williamsia sp. CHRR-6 TaxID=2835871 RepID=UPI001BDA0FD7|nr:NAD(+) diphosphatase [Williamsia sp. CHRR-6]MBT0565634.1 NAD(+) diphosphatase [Williamsia sp. CHRR-6]
MATFEFPEPPLLSRSTVARADELRDDTDTLAAHWPSAQVVEFDALGRFEVDGDRLKWRPSSDIADEIPPHAVFLGIHEGVHRWAIRVATIDGSSVDARVGAGGLDGDEAGLVGTALGVLNWHDAAQFSPVDGHPTEPARAGWTRKNVVTGAEEFPRTDAAIITIVHDGADHALLGRQSGWPARWFSTFAGFVEPGESLEQCVIRELHEETGLDVSNPRYLGSQPWPFPRSLMMGFEARADRDQPLHFIDGEIVEAIWFSRAEIREALEAGSEWLRGQSPAEDDPDGPRLLLPGSISIARQLIAAWAYHCP